MAQEAISYHLNQEDDITRNPSEDIGVREEVLATLVTIAEVLALQTQQFYHGIRQINRPSLVARLLNSLGILMDAMNGKNPAQLFDRIYEEDYPAALQQHLQKFTMEKILEEYAPCDLAGMKLLGIGPEHYKQDYLLEMSAMRKMILLYREVAAKASALNQDALGNIRPRVLTQLKIKEATSTDLKKDTSRGAYTPYNWTSNAPEPSPGKADEKKVNFTEEKPGPSKPSPSRPQSREEIPTKDMEEKGMDSPRWRNERGRRPSRSPPRSRRGERSKSRPRYPQSQWRHKRSPSPGRNRRTSPILTDRGYYTSGYLEKLAAEEGTKRKHQDECSNAAKMMKEELLESMDTKLETIRNEITNTINAHVDQIKGQIEKLTSVQQDTQLKQSAEWSMVISKLTSHLPGERLLKDYKHTAQEMTKVLMKHPCKNKNNPHTEQLQ